MPAPAVPLETVNAICLTNLRWLSNVQVQEFAHDVIGAAGARESGAASGGSAG